jgi:Spy/CpxP family protein refolding chaperone
MFVRLLLTGLLAIGAASAQKGSKGGGSGGGMGDMGGMRAPKQSRLDLIAEKLKLNKEQKDEVQTIISAGQEAAGPLGGQITQGRAALAQAIVQGKSGDELTQIQSSYTDLMAKMTGVEATTYAKIYALLKPNQQSKASSVFEEQMAGMFMGGGGGRRAQ